MIASLNRDHHHLNKTNHNQLIRGHDPLKYQKSEKRKKKIEREKDIENGRLEGKRKWRVLGERHVLDEGKMEKEGSVAEEDEAKASMFSAHTF